jgi:hypothetical protein
MLVQPTLASYHHEGGHHMKRFLAAGAIALALALTFAVEGASAAPLPQPQPPTTTPTPGAPTTGQRTRGPGRGGKAALIRATASVAGLTADQVATELRAGKSLAQIAQAAGKTADDVIKAARADYQTALNQSVTNGRITQAQADAALAQFDQNAPQIANDTTLGQRARGNCPAPADGTPGTTGTPTRARAARTARV